MRGVMRVVLPAVAVLALAGCGDDDDGGGGGGLFGQGGDAAGEAEAGAAGGAGGGPGGGGGGRGGGAVPADDQLVDTMWWTGDDDTQDGESVLNFIGRQVSYSEKAGTVEGDACTGRLGEGGVITVQCTKLGNQAFRGTQAVLRISGATLTATWNDGTVQEYRTWDQ